MTRKRLIIHHVKKIPLCQVLEDENDDICQAFLDKHSQNEILLLSLEAARILVNKER